MSEEQFKKTSGLSRVSKYRRDGLINPVGFAMAGRRTTAFYHPKQIEWFKRKLGITLDDTTGLLNEYQISKLPGLTAIARYRMKGMIKPVGIGMSASNLSYYYHPNQIRELKKKLGITLAHTKGLLNEKRFREASGFSNLAEYRRRGLIKPVGSGMSATKVSFFYRRSQIKELKQKLGVIS